MLIVLELWRLKRLCDVHKIDYQEIDPTLTYYENKRHLISLAHVDLENWTSHMDRYENENFLSYYVTCIQDGSTQSTEVGEPLQTKFSLAEYIKGKH